MFSFVWTPSQDDGDDHSFECRWVSFGYISLSERGQPSLVEGGNTMSAPDYWYSSPSTVNKLNKMVGIHTDKKDIAEHPISHNKNDNKD